MGIAERKLGERELSTAVPLSIATGLAIEAACGVHPEIQVDKAPVLDVQRILINLRTMVRNIHGSVPTEIKTILTTEAVFSVLVEEMQILEAAITKASQGTCIVSFYCCSYSALRRRFPSAAVRDKRSDLQTQYQDLEEAVLKQFRAFGGSHDVRYWDLDFTGRFEDTFIMTHLPVDLLNKDKFTRLRLLESHTGTIKDYPQWNTKLTKGKELTRIPFNRVTMQVFGDNGNQFFPMTRHLRELVVKLAEDKAWKTVTTMDKIKFDISSVKEMDSRMVLLSLL